MSSYHLNHINIRATSLEETRDFYAGVLGLEEGFRPPFPNPGYWMYAGDMPIIHISPLETGSPPRTNPDGMGNRARRSNSGMSCGGGLLRYVIAFGFYPNFAPKQVIR